MSHPQVARPKNPPVAAVMVRQHTPIQMLLDEPNRLVSLHVIGDQVSVILGLTASSGERLIAEVRRALDELAGR
ncbi:hypothetical protein L6E12_14010 [Actinokineospora sp. PR83]|uniref:hypothetical protein n=1 Tax=Actinokineospora sp. PR83 TaxID=2884908 RepID=UPI001F2CEC96|nr:hypothetical protein [Actinokineospora sp. PR83]MCG8916906.1 hypothetical protein [Actinokineospora sp. PR83]